MVFLLCSFFVFSFFFFSSLFIISMVAGPGGGDEVLFSGFSILFSDDF